jgi:lysosomal Pro-X carboxypeptidase
MDRFGMVGDLHELVDRWHFNDLVGQGASRILFTNGGNDMWLHGSYLSDLSDSIVAINMPTGAHHSEMYARPDDTEDVKEGQKRIQQVLGECKRSSKENSDGMKEKKQ